MADERYTNKTMMVDGRFADGAYIIKKSVGRIVCNQIRATGFVISKGLIMTCQHVGSEVSDGDSVIQFQYLEPLSSQNVPGGDVCPEVPETYYLQPSTFYYGSDHYDFAVIAIAKSNRNLKSPQDLRVISCVDVIHARNRSLLADLRLNIFSHPEGKPLVVSVLQKAVENPAAKLVLGNKRRSVTEEIMLHSVNTAMGSSGAPIFDAKWHLVALHQGVAVKEVQSQGRLNDVFYCNYGTLMKYILDEMYSKQDASQTMFEEKLRGCADELGVPFPEFSTKLKDRRPAGPGKNLTNRDIGCLSCVIIRVRVVFRKGQSTQSHILFLFHELAGQLSLICFSRLELICTVPLHSHLFVRGQHTSEAGRWYLGCLLGPAESLSH